MKTKKGLRTGTALRLRQILGVLRRYGILHGITPEKLRLMLEALGPTFIKIGQIMSMRQDMLPAAYLAELEHLRADVAPMACETVLRVLEDEYGVPPHTVFETLDEEPLGSASIAQVHAATLRDGRRVVVKVQRPGIRETMARDITLLRRAADLLRIASGPGDIVDFRAVLSEMWATAQEEMDFLLEAGHMRMFAELNRDVAYMACPQVEQSLTTSKVLVMEHVEGIPIDQTDALTGLGYDMGDIGRKLAAGYVRQILDDGFFHADPHPGNLRIREGRIVWLDLGMMGKLSAHDRYMIREAALAVVRRDAEALERFLLAVGQPSGESNHSRLYGDIDELLVRYGDKPLGELNIGRILGEFVALARASGIRMPPAYTMLGRGIMTLEGVLQRISPDTSFVEILAGHIAGDAVDWEKEVQHIGRALLHSGRKSVELPGQLSDLIRRTLKGQTRLNVEIAGSTQPLRSLDAMVNRVVIALLDAAMLLGSCLLCTTAMQPRILDIPLLGVAGFAGASVLGVWLIVQILRKRRLK